MNDLSTVDQAMARLRAADPAPHPATETTDPHSPMARAMLERVLATPQTTAGAAETPAPRRRRRFALGFGAAGAVAAVTAFTVLQPWSAGPAYSFEDRLDGSVAVTFRPDQLRDPATLNAELARRGARTVVMAMVAAGQCPAEPDLDPSFRLLVDPTEQELAEQLAKWPVKYELHEESVLITILPERIPQGESLVFGYALLTAGGERTTMVRPAVVRSVPACLAQPTPPVR